MRTAVDTSALLALVYSGPHSDHVAELRTDGCHASGEFLVGAYAEQEADTLLTFDEGLYPDYFTVNLVTIREE